MNLREARFRKRKTQWDLAVETGIHQPKISLFERGYLAPRPEERAMLAAALKCHEDDISWPQNGHLGARQRDDRPP